MLSVPWLWMYLGAALMLLEIISPGFVIFFFGLSASTVGLVGFAAGPQFTTTWQLAAFSFFSILYLAVLRRLLKKIFSGFVSYNRDDFDDAMKGRAGTVVETIAPPLAGRVEIGDAAWTAVSDELLEQGENIEVVSGEGLTLKVRRIVRPPAGGHP